jgi:hypothetical protein
MLKILDPHHNVGMDGGFKFGFVKDQQYVSIGSIFSAFHCLNLLSDFRFTQYSRHHKREAVSLKYVLDFIREEITVVFHINIDVDNPDLLQVPHHAFDRSCAQASRQ